MRFIWNSQRSYGLFNAFNRVFNIFFKIGLLNIKKARFFQQAFFTSKPFFRL